MPTAPKRPCPQAGCPVLIDRDQRACEQHARAREQRRGNAGQRGYDHAWRKLREQVLARDPVCTICHEAPSTDADHIVSRRNGGKDQMSNLRGTCHPCHSSKTVHEDGGFGRPNARRGALS